MKRRSCILVLFVCACWLPGAGDGQAAEPAAPAAGTASKAGFTLTEPLDYQVVQRTKDGGKLRICGRWSPGGTGPAKLEARLVSDYPRTSWRKLSPVDQVGGFEATIDAAPGGWYRLEVRATSPGGPPAEAVVEHVGIGEVFVVAGQSNAASHGEERQTSKTGRVATFDGQRWHLSNDPQPGASGGGGSFMPPFGDAMVQRLNVPIGFVACGVGATSVRQWLPPGSRFANPPTLEGNVRKLPDGEWECIGQIYQGFVGRMKPLGPNGFRAVLWHQGESDANQPDPARSLSGPQVPRVHGEADPRVAPRHRVGCAMVRGVGELPCAR